MASGWHAGGEPASVDPQRRSSRGRTDAGRPPARRRPTEWRRRESRRIDHAHDPRTVPKFCLHIIVGSWRPASHAHARFRAIISLAAIPANPQGVGTAVHSETHVPFGCCGTGPDVRYRASEDVDVVAHVMSGSRDEDPGEQHKLQPGSGRGTDYRFGENVGFRVMVEHDGRCTSSAPPARGCGDRGQTEPAHRKRVPHLVVRRRPVIGAESARRSPGQPARGSTKTQRGDNGLGTSGT